LDDFFNSIESLKLEDTLQGVEICGLMSMASFTPNEQQIRAEFTAVQQAFIDIRNRYFNDSSSFNQLSIGMSGDYKIALEYGSTMVRIGTAVFE
jgi:uncharacterized pyridoxal phosphate-containing UPF0001 family protein